jgi:hypothetical protein
MMSCTNLREAFERLIRYLLILSDALTITMSEGRRISDDLRSAWRGATGGAAARRIHFHHGDLLLPLDLRARGASTSGRSALSDARCPVSFDASSASMLFANADLTAPLPTSNPLLAELHEIPHTSPTLIMLRPVIERGKS